MLPRFMLASLVIAALALGLLIAVHEAGHLVVARWMGMRVETYSLGFGPRIAGFRRGDTEYRLSAFPLGGYCKIAGFVSEEPAAQDPADAGSYANKPAWKRFAAIAAGPLTNYLTAFVLLCGLFLAQGVPVTSSTRVDVVPGGPAARAGLRSGDEIAAVDGVRVSGFPELQRQLGAGGPGTRTLEVVRDGQPLRFSVLLEGGRIQVSPQRRYVRLGAGEAVRAAGGELFIQTAATVDALGGALFHQRVGNLAGPVGIVKQAGADLQKGFGDFVWILASISIGLAVFNFLPVPALDGGRLVFLAWEMLTRRRVSPRIEEVLHAVGLLALLVLIVLVVALGDLKLGHRLFGRG